MEQNLIAQNRFGLGGTPDQNKLFLSQPKQKLKTQLTNRELLTSLQSLPDSKQLAEQWQKYRQQRSAFRKLRNEKEKNPDMMSQEEFKQKAKMLRGDGGMRPIRMASKFAVTQIKQQIEAENTISWRLLEFFSNHFSVSAQGNELVTYMAGSLSREAIGPNLYSKFEDLLLAVCRHPAMLLYLNNERSVGPNSPMAQRRKKKALGLNENLAREIMELHTLGVNAGYTQADVTELAKAITGWGLTVPQRENDITFKYRHEGHEPGSRKILGKTYAAGRDQGEKALIDIARNPSTAKFVSTKLVRHFVSDEPNPKLVKALTNTWLKTQGDLRAVMKTLIDSNLSWQEPKQKFKTPNEFLVSTLRLLNSEQVQEKQLLNWVGKLGQKPFSAGSPEGFPDTEADWNNANAILARIDWVNMVASKSRVDLDEILPLVFGDDKRSDNYLQIVRAGSRKEALSLLLLSPEFMRR